MEAESEVKERPQVSFLSSLFLFPVLSSLPIWNYNSNFVSLSPDADLDQKVGAREAKIPFPSWSYSFLNHISCISFLLLSSESESQYPAGLSPSLSGSLKLGGETEVRRGPWLSESLELNSDAYTLPFQTLLT